VSDAKYAKSITVKYAWIDAHRAHWPIRVMCDVLQVSRSGFYAWRHRKDAPPTPGEVQRRQRVAAIAKAFQDSHNIYGDRKIHATLCHSGMNCSPNTVQADCQRHGIKSKVHKKYRVQTTDSKHNHPIAENVLNRHFTASQPNEKWLTDITYIATNEGWLYVVVILDLFSRKIVGYAMAEHLRAELVVSALRMALMRGRTIVGEIGLHSDCGVQFASEQFREVLRLAGISQSMSRKGIGWDKAPCESGFGKWKAEWLDPEDVYATRGEAELAMVEYIEMFDNSKRVHQALGYQTPNECEEKYCEGKHESQTLELTCVLN
jgi:transposase InsO family protein